MAGNLERYLSQQIPETWKVADNQEIGIGNFTAFVKTRYGYSKSSSAATTPLEDGSFATDHIILNPLKLQIEGEVAGVFVKSNPVIKGFIRDIALAAIPGKYLPSWTQTQLSRVKGMAVQSVDVVKKIDGVWGDTDQIYNMFGNKSVNKLAQESFLDELDKLMDSKQVIQIEMPFRVFADMVITDFQVTYDNILDQAISFKISAQQIRIVKTVYRDARSLYKKGSARTAGKENKGVNKTKSVETSFLSRIMGK